MIKLKLLATTATVFAFAPVWAQSPSASDYPNRPIRIVAPFPPGSAGDVIPRAVAPGAGEVLKQNLFIENRPGAAGGIAAEVVAKSAPDGYTLLFGTTGTLAINAALYPKLSYDVMRDFVPIVLCATSAHVIVVAPQLPVATLKEYIAFAKSKPGQLNLASSGAGTAVHLSGELFNSLTGIKTVHVAYKGGAEALTDLIAGRVHVMFASMSSAVTLIRSGKVKALAVTSAERNAALPDLPTVREAAVPGYNVTGFFGLLAPAGTPRAIVTKLNENITIALKTPETKERLSALGVDVTWSTPEQFGDQIRDEIAQWTRAVKSAGAKAD